MSSLEISQSYLAEALRRMLDVALPTIRKFPAPGAGQEFSLTVPGGALWMLNSLRVTLTTDATAANRLTVLTFDDGTDDFQRYFSNTSQTASSSWALAFIAGLGYVQGSGSPVGINFGMGDHVLRPGYRLRSVTASLQAGDAYGQQVLQVVEVSAAALAQLSADLEDELRATFGLGIGIQ